MADIMSAAKRSRLMSRIKGKDTKLEVRIRKALHARGLRYRLGGAGLPGRPDLVFPRYRAIVFVHGCFWHRHTCHLFRMPATRRELWEEKIGSNQTRDRRVADELYDLGWRQCVIWECAVRDRDDAQLASVANRVAKWLRGNRATLAIPESAA